MNLTPEQQAIIQSTGNIKINAVAGSGKTTTLIEYARTRPSNSRILYLAFNKSVKLEAVRKFSTNNLLNVKVETAHSLAYKHIVFKSHYKVKPQGYKTNEIVEILGLKGSGEKHSEYIVANHIKKFISYFCNSDKSKVQELNYLDTVADPKAKRFVEMAYDYIESQTRLLLGKMDKGQIEVIHDFYLKKFQLWNPSLPFDYILFDEGQDASGAMLDVFLKQQATKVIVGDTHQQIYGWRFAINSLEKTDFKSYNLSTSFRFGQPIADLAKEALRLKKHIEREHEVVITGKGQSEVRESRAVLGRSNVALLLKAIDLLSKNKIKHIYFEGNFNSYTYADEGASLYDVLNLYNGKRYLIKDQLIKAMKDIKELEDYIEKTEDNQLGMMVEIVLEYGNEIPKIIQSIKDKHVDDNEREKAEIIFSTVHRRKGLEYDDVYLVEDFITEEKLNQILTEKKEEEINREKLNEEINLLYVAMTRARVKVHVPESFVPSNFPASPHIHILKETDARENYRSMFSKEKSQGSTLLQTSKSYGKVREKHAGAYKPWTPEQDDELTKMYCEMKSVRAMADHFGRTMGAIQARIKRLELHDLYG